MAPFFSWFIGGSPTSVTSLSWNQNNKCDFNKENLLKQAYHGRTCHIATSKVSSLSCLSDATTSTIHDDGDLCRLILSLGASPSRLLRFFTSPGGIRGVCLNEAVGKGDILLKVPLSSCLRDDEPPSWLQQESFDHRNNPNQALEIQGWVARLAASLLEAQSNKDTLPEGIRKWLTLLPQSLRESLPVYWSESMLQATGCRSLELAVDSAFFARVAPLADLSVNSDMTQAQIEQALDLVQTRACRCSALHDDEDLSADLRVLVPIFDMINHHYEPNAEYFRQGDSMVVRALRDMGPDEEVLIHYGSATIPAWRCLLSYGFVPSAGKFYEHEMAEIVVDDHRFQVSPTEIPFELVQYHARKLGYKDMTKVEFTPEIGRAIVDQLEVSAEAIKPVKASHDAGEDSSITIQLVNNLREFHRKTLLACASGLREYVEESQV